MQSKKTRKSQPPKTAWSEIMKKAAQEPGVPEILRLLESQQKLQGPGDRSVAGLPDLLPTSRTSTVG